MTKSDVKFFLYVAASLLFSVAAGILAVKGFYWFCGLSALAASIALYGCVKIYRRPRRELDRFISAVRHCDLTASFDMAANKGIDTETAGRMREAMDIFNKRMQEKEVDLVFYELLLGRIDIAMVVTNKTGNIIWVNKFATDIFGKPRPGSIIDLKKVNETLPDIMSALAPGEVKTVRLNGDSGPGFVLTTAKAILKGEEIRVYSLKNIQPALDENEEIAWEKLIRILTHEIMNSLTPILSLTETFSDPAKEYDQETMSQALAAIRRRSDGLMKFISNYRRLTLVPELNIEEFPVGEVIRDMTFLFKDRNVSLEYFTEPDDIVIRADRAQLEQVLINLIKNAVEADPLKKNLRVGLRFTQDEYRRPVIDVSDNGPGILPHVIDKIFVPFYSTKPDGSGIGLSLCRQVITAHGGTISVRSEVDRGTRFTIRL